MRENKNHYKDYSNYYYMRLLSKLELIGFYWCGNNECKEIDPSEVFPTAYGFVIDITLQNLQEKLMETRGFPSWVTPMYLTIPKEKYEEQRRKIRNHMQARFRLEDRVITFRVSLRKDEKITKEIIVKPPAALLLYNENLGFLVLREARIYNKKFYKGEFVIRNEKDLTKDEVGVLQEPYVISLKELINLDLKVITEPYESSMEIVESAVLYIRKFYPLVLSQLRDVDIEEIRPLLKRFVRRCYKHGIIFGDFDLDQIAIGTIDNNERGIIITDPEFAYFSRKPKKLSRYLWEGYKEILGPKAIVEILSERKFDVDYTLKRLEEAIDKYNKGSYKDFINALYQDTGNRKEAHQENT